MARITLALPIALAGVLVVAATALASRSSTPTLKGTVGPGFTITLTENGKKVSVLKPGTYRFVIADRSSIHNFTLQQLRGGTFQKQLTSTPFVGTKTVTVPLRAGKWKFYCSVHASLMFGFLNVGASASTASSSSAGASTTTTTTTTAGGGYSGYGG